MYAQRKGLKPGVYDCRVTSVRTLLDDEAKNILTYADVELLGHKSHWPLLLKVEDYPESHHID